MKPGEKSEQLIDLLYIPEKGKVKPRTYRIKARKACLSCAKQRTCWMCIVSADTIYGTRENRAYMKAHNIIYTGTALGRRPKNLDKESNDQEKERKK